MILHAIWTGNRLHFWGESLKGVSDSNNPGNSCSTYVESNPNFSLNHTVLRQCVGDVWDSLLVSGATDSELTVRLPHQDGYPIASFSTMASRDVHNASVAITLQPLTIDTISFTPADAVDLLGTLPTHFHGDVEFGASLSYWSKVSILVLNLLAGQRFVPAIHATINGSTDHQYRGFWRVVVDDEKTSHRIKMLITSMPPVCRAIDDSKQPIQASELVESYLWQAVDSLVRRCLEGDELAHAIQERNEQDTPMQMRWLQSLVCYDSIVQGPVEEQRMILENVRSWLHKLESTVDESTCKTCFQLHPPDNIEDESLEAQVKKNWRLTIHVQSRKDPSLIVDAQRLSQEADQEPRILKRPFDDTEVELRQDIARASRHFNPLVPCSEDSGPYECQLNLDEAYTFLRDAAPILESEGFGVWLPHWWRSSRPRFLMRLDIKPMDSGSSVGTTTMRLDSLVSYDWRVAIGDEVLSMEEIEQLSSSMGPLLNIRGQWMEVQAADLQKTVSFLQDNRSGEMTVFEALRQCYIADDLETGLSVGGIRAHGWVDKLLNATNSDESFEILDPPKNFIGELRNYQQKGVSWLRFMSRIGMGACLADDMGLGKTIQFIGLLLIEKDLADETFGPTLLVVPTSLVGNWQRELERFAPSITVMVHHGMERLSGQEFLDEVVHHDVVISTYALTYRDYDHLAAVKWYRVALDEAQNIKNPAAKQSQAIRSIQAIQRVALTGTPVENHLSELWSIMEFLNSGFLGTAADFRRRFAMPIERFHDEDRAQRLRQLIRPFVLRRLKSDPNILDDLPEKMEMKVYCNLTPEQAAMYEAVVNDMIGQIDQSDGIQRRGLILATLVKLKQICNHPVQLLKDSTSLMKRSGKCNRLTEMLEVVIAEGDRALIFTQYRQMGDLLQKLLGDTFGMEILFLHGGTARLQRDKLVDRFQSYDQKIPLFILSLKAGGFGLNLTAARHVFHFDRWWNPAVEDQATDRAHRVGQDKQVQVHKFVCIGTLEEKIDALLEKKRVLAKNVIGTGEQWLTSMSTDQLRDLFSLSREAVAGE